MTTNMTIEVSMKRKGGKTTFHKSKTINEINIDTSYRIELHMF